MVNKHTVLRYHCAECKRFLCKIVIGSPFALVAVPCSNCKRLNLISSDGKKVLYKILTDKSSEPDGIIHPEELDKIMKNAIELLQID